MKPARTCRGAAAATLALLLAGCAGAPEVPPQANFAPRVLADGTKLFTYTVPLQKPRPARQSALRDEPVKPIRPAEYRRGLEALLAENGYCRDGYLLLEQYENSDRHVIRGECRDTADASEQARFGG